MSKSFEKQLHHWTHMIDEAMEDKSKTPLALHSGMTFDDFEEVIDPGLKHGLGLKIFDKLDDALSSYDIEEFYPGKDSTFCFEVGTRGEMEDDCCGPYDTGRKFYIPTGLEDEEIIDDIEKCLSDNGFEIRWKVDYKKDAWPEEDLKYEMESIPCKDIYDDGIRCYPDSELPVDAHVILRGQVFVTDPEKAEAACLGSSSNVTEDEDGEMDESEADYKYLDCAKHAHPELVKKYPGRSVTWYSKMARILQKRAEAIKRVDDWCADPTSDRYKALLDAAKHRFDAEEQKLLKMPVRKLPSKPSIKKMLATEDVDDLTCSPDFDPMWMRKDMYLARTNGFYTKSKTAADGSPERWWTISEDPSSDGFSRKSPSWKVTPAGKQKIFDYLRFKSSREDFEKGEALFQELVDPANGLAEMFREKSMDPKTQVVVPETT